MEMFRKFRIFNLALLRRSVLLESRYISTALGHLALAATLGIILYIFQEETGRYSRSAMGLQFFAMISVVNIIFISMGAIAFFPSAVTEEKEDNTLQLLLMTGISPLTLLLSKFASRLWTGFRMLLIQVPFTVLAIALGGLSMAQVWAGFFVLLSYVFMLCGLALFMSTIASTTRQAAALTLLGIVSFFGMPIIVYLVCNIFLSVFTFDFSGWERETYIFKDWVELYPPVRIMEICQTKFNGTFFGIQFCSNMGFGLVGFILSLLFFNRFSRKKASSAPARGMLAKSGAKSKLRLLSVSRAWKNALAWKEFHFSSGGKVGIVVRCLIYTLLLVFIMIFARRETYNMHSFARNVGAFTLMMGLWLFPLELTFLVSNMFASELQWKTFSGVCTLPSSMSKLLLSKILGFLPAVLPVIIYTLIGFLIIPKSQLDLNDEVLLAAWFYCIGLLFYLTLVGYLTLFMKYSAFIVAALICLGITLLTGVIMNGVMRLHNEKAFFMVLSVFALCGIPLLLRGIFQRLRTLMANA